MKHSARPHVLDASALLVLFEQRRSADTVENLIRKARDGQVTLHMSVLNWGEVLYTLWRHHGANQANQLLQDSSRFSIKLHDANLSDARRAAEFRVRFALPYVDVFAAVLASRLRARLVTADTDFEQVKTQVKLLRLPS